MEIKLNKVTKFAPGQWTGVVLDTPNGKNNGSVKDVRYFTCKADHGLFVKSDAGTIMALPEIAAAAVIPALRAKSTSLSCEYTTGQ